MGGKRISIGCKRDGRTGYATRRQLPARRLPARFIGLAINRQRFRQEAYCPPYRRRPPWREKVLPVTRCHGMMKTSSHEELRGSTAKQTNTSV